MTPIETVAAPSGPVRPPPSAPWGAPESRDAWPTPVQQDLLRATLLPDRRALDAWERIRPLMNVEDMDGGVSALVPQLGANLRALGCQDPLLELFKGVHRHTWAKNQLLLAQAMPLVAALEAAGITTLLLKGAALLAGGRHDAGVRAMTDIDVLVSPDEAEAAADVLVESGMWPIAGAPPWYVTRYLPQAKNSWNFRNSDGGELDLHWQALSWSRHRLADGPLWAAAEPVTLRGVQTRALCPTDELLAAIVHGVRWNPTPSYRWVLDATLSARSSSTGVDWDRLVEQARWHRVEVAVAKGLRLLRVLAGLDVPREALSALRAPAPLQRLELRAQSRQPQRRSALAHAASIHLQYVRRQVEPGSPVRIGQHLRLAARRLGVTHLRQLPALLAGGVPGPGRPVCEEAAPLGTGICSPPPLRWGAPIDFADPDAALAHCRYGLWLPDENFAWIAGREARLAFELPEPPPGSLLLSLTAGSSEQAPPQRLQLTLGNARVAEIRLGPGGSFVDGARVLLPSHLVAGQTRLEIGLRAPDAVIPARRRINDDLRLLGVNLWNITLQPPAPYEAGQPLRFEGGTEDESFLAGGWGETTAGGRLTQGSEPRLILRPSRPVAALEWEASPLGETGPGRVELEALVNGIPIGLVDPGGSRHAWRLPLPPETITDELIISWRIRSTHTSKRFWRRPARPPALVFRSATLI